jgi:hypothetical protein
MTGCGYTPAEIGELSFHDVLNLFAYWREFPPVHEILKCVYRIERSSNVARNKNSSDPSGIGSLIARFPDGLVRAEKI